ncbi:dihydrofolate reductase family protein [Youngiibacter fragilis]|uniref:Dihydrofolate reductase n=1 Tax=Youngiibacter fragilis 232.1 TaxID=994573 RepID=V7I273_9CLOT|nr:dihydrofolate reductase family protein [Youngiibacter fragilis]ETA79386.1 dihydrofolate reductase [Youngiibacter fragilis 232.1]
MKKREAVVYIAQSLDGFIAREDGDISWLDMVASESEDYGYGEFLKSVDTVVLGRKTYEKVNSMSPETPYIGKRVYVLTKEILKDDDDVVCCNDAEKLFNELNGTEGRRIFIDGGALTIKSLRDIDMIDRYVISIIPVMIGRGIRLFLDLEESVIAGMKLVSCSRYESGLVQLEYAKA